MSEFLPRRLATVRLERFRAPSLHRSFRSSEMGPVNASNDFLYRTEFLLGDVRPRSCEFQEARFASSQASDPIAEALSPPFSFLSKSCTSDGMLNHVGLLP